jgi:predicted CXXCH cytochrome family protein
MSASPKKSFLCLTLMLFLVGLLTDAGIAGLVDKRRTASEKNKKCLECHGSVAKVGSKFVIDPVRYKQGKHARIGCPACHLSFTEKHPATVGTSPTPECRECHREIADEYAVSSHASKADCINCHDPHQVNPPAEISGQAINRMCAACHERFRIIAIHSKWLPQTELHIEMIPCITCHTGSGNYDITLYLIRRQEGSPLWQFDLVGYDELNRLTGGKSILSLIDKNSDNHISLSELLIFNRGLAYSGLRLQAEITPERVVHSFRKFNNCRDCSFCHALGPDAKQTVFIAFPEKNGCFRQVAVEKEAVPDALYGAPDFYMMGKTRNATLTNVGLLIIAAGFVIATGRCFIRFAMRQKKNGEKGRHV